MAVEIVVEGMSFYAEYHEGFGAVCFGNGRGGIVGLIEMHSPRKVVIARDLPMEAVVLELWRRAGANVTFGAAIDLDHLSRTYLMEGISEEDICAMLLMVS